MLASASSGGIMRKSILITGCSSGIGLNAAQTLSRKGWRVFATCRQEKDCERLRGQDLESFVLDYADQASIKAALAETLSRTGGTLDAVYNNGAYALPGAAEDLSRDALRAIFETNFFGYVDLINRVLPVMRAQGHGRIVNCSSVLGFSALKYRGAYVASKYALEGMSDAMRLELRGTNIQMILLEPGPIPTRIRQNAQKQFEKWIDWENSAHLDLYQSRLIPRLYDTSRTPDFGELPCSAVTDRLIHALEKPRPKPRYYITLPTHIAAWMNRLLSTRMRDYILGKN